MAKNVQKMYPFKRFALYDRSASRKSSQALQHTGYKEMLLAWYVEFKISHRDCSSGILFAFCFVIPLIGYAAQVLKTSWDKLLLTGIILRGETWHVHDIIR